MITPLNYLLSGYNESFEYDSPVDIKTYMNDDDYKFVIVETDALIHRLRANISMGTDALGEEMVDRLQLVNSEVKEIDVYSALLLNRALLAAKRYEQEGQRKEEPDQVLNLENNNIVMRIEGNKYYVYTFVYAVMTDKALQFDKKIQKIAHILELVENYGEHSYGDASVEDEQNLRVDRLKLLSNSSYWMNMLTLDHLKHFGTPGPAFKEDTLRVVRSELKEMGFPGFVNPIKMYYDFVSARVKRKTEVNVDNEVLTFLKRVVRSGGMSLSENYT